MINYLYLELAQKGALKDSEASVGYFKDRNQVPTIGVKITNQRNVTQIRDPRGAGFLHKLKTK